MTSQLVDANLDHWKRKLLDLSKRNRLLNFKPSRVSTITVVDELPAAVFRILAGNGQQMRFRPADRPGEEAGATGADEELEDFERFTPPADGAAPAERHNDTWLQTRLEAAKLDHNLRRIADQAASVLEEQGISTLFLALGMLHWYEADDSDERRRAPLLMLPVRLSRRSAGAAYTVAVGDDDAVLNPALVEFLRSSFGIKLPELPEVTDEYDPTPLMAQIAETVASQRRWEVTNEIVLGLFSFQKFVMFKDLERHRDTFAAHRLIDLLATRKGAGGFGLPDDVTGMRLDEEFPPEETFQVVDADSSQQRAIAAVARGHDLVMQGPPGTGKSQTITNLVAHALAAGKSVLFVSEKMAALQVVYGRLKAAGLGDFCLELHSGKANKRAVMSEIARSLDNSLVAADGAGAHGGRLQEVRQRLTDYAAAVHTPEPPLGLTPYQAYGILASLGDAASLRLRRPVDAVSDTQLADAKRRMGDLAAAAAAIGDPTRHPWRDTTRTYFTADDRADLEDALDGLLAECDAFLRVAPQAQQELGLPELTTLAHAERATMVADLLERSPGATLDVLQSDAWNSPPPEAQRIVALGRRATEGMGRALERFHPGVLERDHEADAAVIERMHRKLFRMLSGDYRRVRKAWLGWRVPGYKGTLGEQAAHMRAVDHVRGDGAALGAADGEARQLFGSLWHGPESDWDALGRYVDWVVEFRSACVRHGLASEAAQRGSRPHPDMTITRTLAGHAAGIATRLGAVGGLVGWPAGYLRDAAVEEISERAFALRGNLGLYTLWATFYAAREAVLASAAGEALEAGEAAGIAYGDLPAAFERAFLQKWLDGLVLRRPVLVDFQVVAHEQRLAEFRDLDRAVLRANRSALVARQRAGVQERLRALRDTSGMQYLRGQMTRQRGHAALRRTLREAHAPIKAIKPCFMMSPLTVAQFLDPQEHVFDLVVFDEASQLTAEDAVGAVVRGKQLVVVGDQKQLPPTTFFAVQSGQVEAEQGENGEPLVEDLESILEQFMSAGLPTTRLRWHYRSKHESLIAFSNVNFYDSELHTFPSADTDTRERGLQFIYVPDGLYEGAGLNRAEARRVADAVVEFAREQLGKPEEDRLTLGVGTFNLRQQIAIQDELEGRRRQDPSLEAFFAPRDEGAFFVKNLENIQGDDRDVIFLSVTYAKGIDGKLRHNFGPINGDNGWRRLNVLTTRARLRMRVYSSMHGEDIDPTKTQAAGARYLRDFLQFAERGQLVGAVVERGAETESPFEYGLFRELSRRGLRLVPQVGVAGYRIDLGVLDDEVQGRFICGIECDGAAYHAAESARDRDRLRQQVLEGLGWTLHRVWSTDWFKDRESTVQRLIAKVEETRRRARARAAEAMTAGEPLAAPPDAAAAETLPDAAGASAAGTPHDQESREFPAAAAYRLAVLGQRDGGRGVLNTSLAALLAAIAEVAQAEAPVHQDDLMDRVAEAFGDHRVGARIARQLEGALMTAARRGVILRRGEFVYLPNGAVAVRSRAGTGIPGERIAPEECREAVLLVLLSNGARPRPDLVNAVRTVLGFSRTGERLEMRIGQAIEALERSGQIGEGSAGLAVIG